MSIPILSEEGFSKKKFREIISIEIFGVKIFENHHNFQIILNLLENIGNNCCINTCKENGTLRQIIDLIKVDIEYIIVDPITNIFNIDNSNIDNSSSNIDNNTVTKKRRKGKPTILKEENAILKEENANLKEENANLKEENANLKEEIKQLTFAILNASNLLGDPLTKNSEHVDNQKKRQRSDSLDPDSLNSEIQQDDSIDSTIEIPDSLNFELQITNSLDFEGLV